jgi:hypothetical protein
MKAFRIIIKVDSVKFVKYRSSNLNNFFNKFLLTKFPNSRFANIYDKKTGKLVATWGKHKGLVLN